MIWKEAQSQVFGLMVSGSPEILHHREIWLLVHENTARYDTALHQDLLQEKLDVRVLSAPLMAAIFGNTSVKSNHRLTHGKLFSTTKKGGNVPVAVGQKAIGIRGSITILTLLSLTAVGKNCLTENSPLESQGLPYLRCFLCRRGSPADLRVSFNRAYLFNVDFDSANLSD